MKSTLQFAPKELTNLFPKLDKEPTYSLGYTRWSKLSLQKQKAMMVLNNFDHQACLNKLEIN